jgi:hypothetical protein
MDSGGGNTNRSCAHEGELAGDTGFCRHRFVSQGGRVHAMKLSTTTAAFAVVAALVLSPALGQHHPGEAPASGPYAPRLGDLMILQQIRHAKLWFAVAANNWPLAEHELGGLQDGFADLARLYPAVQGVTVAPVIAALKERELANLGEAVAAQDRIKFVAAYDQLTAACNACHQTTQHGFVVIQQPISPPFNNQSFAPAGPGGGQGMPGHPH